MIATTPDRALEVGKAAEHLVCADLIMSGYRAFLTDQGLPYDVVVDLAGRLIRVQVKATALPKPVPNRPGSGISYQWHCRRAGKGSARLIGNDDFDILALVALDIRVVAYMRMTDRVLQTIHLRMPNCATKHNNRRWANIDQHPFGDAIQGLTQ